MHHAVGDARAAGNFLVAWGHATRDDAFDPVPFHDRASLFLALEPPRVNFEHRGVEFKQRRRQGENAGRTSVHDDKVVVQSHKGCGSPASSSPS
jgi:shikimate O-hydroxycinnamoyltransferase